MSLSVQENSSGNVIMTLVTISDTNLIIRRCTMYFVVRRVYQSLHLYFNMQISCVLDAMSSFRDIVILMGLSRTGCAGACGIVDDQCCGGGCVPLKSGTVNHGDGLSTGASGTAEPSRAIPVIQWS